MPRYEEKPLRRQPSRVIQQTIKTLLKIAARVVPKRIVTHMNRAVEDLAKLDLICGVENKVISIRFDGHIETRWFA